MMNSSTDLRLERLAACPICNEDGQPLYKGLWDPMIKGRVGNWGFQRCVRCGHAWLTSRYTRQHIFLAYENYSYLHWPEELPFSRATWKLFLKDAFFAGAYGYDNGVPGWMALLGRILSYLPTFDQILGRQVRFLSAQEGGRLLDIGAGNGWFLQNMQRLGWQAEGVDTDSVSVERARKRGVRVRSGTVEDQSYPEGYFDAVTLSHVIEHVHDPLQTLSECHRVLRSGAKLVIFTPNLESLGHRRFRAHWINLDPPRHLQLFTFRSIQIAIERAGFELEKLTSTGYRAVGSWLKSRSVQEDGYYGASDQIVNWNKKLRGYGFYALENASLLWDKRAGEEIMLIARKPFGSSKREMRESGNYSISDKDSL